MQEQLPNTASTRRIWRIRMVLFIVTLLGASVVLRFYPTNTGIVIPALAVFTLANFLLPAIGRARADADPAFAKGYRAASWALWLPGTRLQISAMLLGAFLIMIPLGRAMGWLAVHEPQLRPMLPHSLKLALLVAFVIALVLELGALALYRQWRGPQPGDDSLI